MLLRSIRSRLLALVVAMVIPFTVLIGAGLWGQWQSDQVAATQRNINEVRILAAQVDDQIGNLDNRITHSNEGAAIVRSLIAMPISGGAPWRRAWRAASRPLPAQGRRGGASLSLRPAAMRRGV
jgi:hypothetical protein